MEIGPVWVFEVDGGKGKKPVLAGGLCLATEKGNPFYGKILEEYTGLPFYDSEGKISSYIMNPLITRLFLEKGLRRWQHRGDKRQLFLPGRILQPSRSCDRTLEKDGQHPYYSLVYSELATSSAKMEKVP